jgi:hypothetical protein
MQGVCSNSFTRAAACALAIACLSAAAENPPAPRLMVITTTTIKPDARASYEAYMGEVTGMFKKAGVPMRGVWQTAMGDLLEYVTVYPIGKFADLDGDTPQQKILGKEKAAEMLRRAGTYLTSVHRGVLFERPDLSIMKDGGGPTAYAVVVRYSVAPGRFSDFEHWLKTEGMPANRQGGAKQMWSYQGLFNGSAEYILVYPIDTMAQLDQGPPSWRMEGGRAAAERMANRLHGIVTDEKLSIARYRPDLSYAAQ